MTPAVKDEDRHSADGEKPIVITGEQARQGEIVLRSKWRRLIFLAGLCGVLVIIVILRLASS
jgi:hypothetical protein